MGHESRHQCAIQPAHAPGSCGGRESAHLFLNLSRNQAQVTFRGWPAKCTARSDPGSVAAALAKANKDFIASNPFTSADKRGAAAKAPFRPGREFNGDMGRALKALEESGKTDKTRRTAYPGYPKKTLGSGRSLPTQIHRGRGVVLSWAEVINREASAIAAHRLARQAGMSHEQGYDLARRAISKTHFDYSPGNRARFMRGCRQSADLFKQYSLNISWQLGHNACLMARGGSKAEGPSPDQAVGHVGYDDGHGRRGEDALLR